MRRLERPVFVGAIVLGAVAAVACGPSFQAIYEGDARFEHCYALEDTPNTRMQDKTACWRDWSMHYTYGQTRDRVEYAKSRARALARVNGEATDEALMQAAPGEGADDHGVAAPAPTNAFAPPPKTLAEVDAGSTQALLPDAAFAPLPVVPVVPATAVPISQPSSPPFSSPPAADCSDPCTHTWQSCTGTCRKEDGTCDKCQKAYKTCMKGCFKGL